MRICVGSQMKDLVTGGGKGKDRGSEPASALQRCFRAQS